MKKTLKKPWKILIVIFCVLLSLFAVFVIISCIGSDACGKYVEMNFAPVGPENPSFYFDDETGAYTFIKDDARDFRILQLTDTHIGGGIFSIGKDRKAMDAIYKMVSGTSPDLIIITGDITYPFPFQSGNVNNNKTAGQIAALMEKMRVPWTLVFGNHDNEVYSFAGRERLADIYSSEEYKYCVFTKNPVNAEITGYGNQLINIRNSDGTLNNVLALFDSNTYVKGNIFKYDIVHDDQVEWYKSSITSLSTPENGFSNGELVPSLAFLHVPMNEYQTAWDLHRAGSEEVEYLYGVCDEKILAPAIGKKLPKGRLFDEMVALGSTKGVFCGHNHKNNFAIVYKGIQLTFSKSIVYLGLFGIANTDAYRGGTIIEIKSDGSFQSLPVGINEV